MNTELINTMAQSGIRIGTIIHVQGSCPNLEHPSEALEAFIEECGNADYVIESLSKRWPEYAELIPPIFDNSQIRPGMDRDDRRDAELAFNEAFCKALRKCPFAFLVKFESSEPECIFADPREPMLGDWVGDWGLYNTAWVFADSIEESVGGALMRQRKAMRISWQRAIDEGRVI